MKLLFVINNTYEREYRHHRRLRQFNVYSALHTVLCFVSGRTRVKRIHFSAASGAWEDLGRVDVVLAQGPQVKAAIMAKYFYENAHVTM